MKFPIVEIFTSIQGEGINLGRPANFIRFAGCNLNCPWCDTEWRKANKELTISEILDALDPTVKLVVLTGGEPMMQKNLFGLTAELYLKGFRIAVETNGSYPTRGIREMMHTHIACSPKPQNNWKVNSDCIFDELKYVVDDALTVEHIACLAERSAYIYSIPIWLQPEGSNMQEAWKKALQMQKELAERVPGLDVRIGVQLHKIMEVR